MSHISSYSSYKNNTVQSDYIAIVDDCIFRPTNSIYCVFYSVNQNTKVIPYLLGFEYIQGNDFKIHADKFTAKLYKTLVKYSKKYNFSLTFGTNKRN